MRLDEKVHELTREHSHRRDLASNMAVTPVGLRGVIFCGDNLEALQSLEEAVPAFAAPRLAYLDPPFNTQENWNYYEDSKSSKTWADDLRARLVEIKRVLAEDGSVWLHLDDREQHRGRVLMDEVFGASSFIATIIWQRRTSRENRTAISVMHDYIHVYAPMGPKRWKLVRNGLEDTGKFSNPDGDPRGPWRSVPISVQGGHGTAAQYYEVTTPAGITIGPPEGRCWAYNYARFVELVDDGRIYWPRAGAGRPRLKRYEFEVRGLTPTSIWTASEVGDNSTAKKQLMAEAHSDVVFDTPKPEGLLERIIHVATDRGDTVLDPYLGSGTTAVVATSMARNWIGMELSREVVETIVVPRLARQAGLAGATVSDLLSAGVAVVKSADPGDMLAAG